MAAPGTCRCPPSKLIRIGERAPGLAGRGRGRAVPHRAVLTHLDRLSFPAAKWLCTVCQRPRAAFPAPGSLWADTLLLIPSSPSRCLSPGRPSRSPDSPAAADAVSLAPDNREPLGRAGGRTPPDRHERSRTDTRMDVENVGSRRGMRGGRQSRRRQTDKRRTDRQREKERHQHCKKKGSWPQGARGPRQNIQQKGRRRERGREGRVGSRSPAAQPRGDPSPRRGGAPNAQPRPGGRSRPAPGMREGGVARLHGTAHGVACGEPGSRRRRRRRRERRRKRRKASGCCPYTHYTEQTR